MQIDFATMIQRLGQFLDPQGSLWTLIFYLSYFLACVLAVVSAMQLKATAEERGTSYKVPFMTFIAAVLFAALPETVGTVGATLFGNEGASNPLAYSSGGGPAPIDAVLSVVQFIGICFFMRAIIELKRAGEPQRYQNASIGRAVMMFIGAIGAIQIRLSIKMFGATFGWDVSGYVS